jgi:hypothetical protein
MTTGPADRPFDYALFRETYPPLSNLTDEQIDWLVLYCEFTLDSQLVEIKELAPDRADDAAKDAA